VNCASIFPICFYMHIGRNVYFGPFKCCSVIFTVYAIIIILFISYQF
jgi:quinol-cytochrome oxidoreductase complex cytochrome b subunit